MKRIVENFPFWLFGLVVFSLPFVNFPNLRKYGYPIQLTDFLFLLTGLVWLIYLVLRKNKLRISWFYLPLSLYFVSLCLSTIFSEDQSKSFIKLLGVTYLLGLAVLAFNLVDDKNKLRKIGMIWLSATFIVCFVSIVSVILFYLQRDNPILEFTLSHYGSLPTGNYPRLQTTFVHQNMLGNYLNASVVFLFLAHYFNWLKREVLLIFTPLFAVTVFFTVSPGIGGILLITGLWFWLDFKSTKPILSKLFLIVGISAAIFFFIAILPSPTNFPHKLEPSPRVLTWMSSIDTFFNNPILGRGVGMDAADVSYLSINGQQYLTDAHQLWLNIAAQQGLVGLLAIIFLTVWFFRKSLPLDIKNTPIKTALGLGLIGTFIYQGLGGSFEDARHLWVLIGLLGSISEEQ